LEAGYKLEFYFFNPNIHPESEYKKRLAEVKKLARHFGVKLKIGDYDHEAWLDAMRGHEINPKAVRAVNYALPIACVPPPNTPAAKILLFSAQP